MCLRHFCIAIPVYVSFKKESSIIKHRITEENTIGKIQFTERKTTTKNSDPVRRKTSAEVTFPANNPYAINAGRIKQFLTDLLFPRRCPVCGGIVLPKGELICPGCVKKLSFVKQPVCKKCGKEITSAEREYCLDCTKHKRSFDYGRALLNYNDTAKKSMADIKYRNRREYLDFYAEAVCLRYGRLLMRLGADALVPVPVHPSRRRQRGFNQAEIFADRIGERLGIPVCPKMLVRRKKTAPQKQLNPKERLHNLEEAFAAGAVPEGVTRVILVDDIYTTGSTMEACARALLRAGVKNVYFIAICIGRGQ